MGHRRQDRDPPLSPRYRDSGYRPIRGAPRHVPQPPVVLSLHGERIGHHPGHLGRPGPSPHRGRRVLESGLGGSDPHHRSGLVLRDEDPLQPASVQPGGRAGVGAPDGEEDPPAAGEHDLVVHAEDRSQRPAELRPPGRHPGDQAREQARGASLRGWQRRIRAPGAALRGPVQEPVPERLGLLRQRRIGHEVQDHVQPDVRRNRQPRLRPGRGRSGGDQPDCVRNPLPGEASVLHRGRRDLQLRRGRSADPVLAPHRPAAARIGPELRHLQPDAHRHDHPRRGEAHRKDGERVVARAPRRVGRAGIHHLARPAERRELPGGRAADQLLRGARAQGDAPGSDDPGRAGHGGEPRARRLAPGAERALVRVQRRHRLQPRLREADMAHLRFVLAELRRGEQRRPDHDAAAVLTVLPASGRRLSGRRFHGHLARRLCRLRQHREAGGQLARRSGWLGDQPGVRGQRSRLPDGRGPARGPAERGLRAAEARQGVPQLERAGSP